MGREIRRVPQNWAHPMRKCPHSPWAGGCDTSKKHNGMCYQPMFDEDFDIALKEWVDGYELWKKGEHPDQEDYEYWEWCGAPPSPKYYHHNWQSAEWYQIYETVSEGTPVTPPFSTKAELVEYLVSHGDYWDQLRGDGGWDRKNAESFVESEWAISAVFIDGEMKCPRDGS